MRKQRFAVGVAHRRCGKTVAAVNDLIRLAALNPRGGASPGRYGYIAPFLNQAKEVAWAYLKFYAEPLLVRTPNESELYVEIQPHGARIRIYGADNADRLRGGYFDHVVMDEFGDMNPTVWPLIVRPMLSDYQGGATFIGSAKGRNAFCELFEAAEHDPNWYRFRLPASETRIIPKAELEAARRDMTEEEFLQEYETSFEAALRGAYYGREVAQAEREGRITDVPIQPGFEVHTAWDMGVGQNMPVWCFQVIGEEVHVVDCIEDYDATVERMSQTLTDRGYTGTDYVPHDARARELSSGRTRIETLVRCGRKPKVVGEHTVMDGVNAVRVTFPRIWFDAERCKPGLEALRQYKADYDEKKKTFLDRPRHDWASHFADAARYMCIGWREDWQPVAEPKKVYEPPKGLNRTTWDELIEYEDRSSTWSRDERA